MSGEESNFSERVPFASSSAARAVATMASSTWTSRDRHVIVLDVLSALPDPGFPAASSPSFRRPASILVMALTSSRSERGNALRAIVGLGWDFGVFSGYAAYRLDGAMVSASRSRKTSPLDDED